MSINTVTMTTVEIAELTGKAHKNVLRDAHAMLKKVNGLRSELVESTYMDRKGEMRPMLVLDKHLTFTLITGYDTGLRHEVVGRWIELEAQANPGFLAETVKDTLNTLQARINAMAPAFAEHTRKGRTIGYGLREACRIAGIDHPDKFLKLLMIQGRARETPEGHIQLHPSYAAKGFVKPLKPSNLITENNGGHLFKITAKGLAEWLTTKAMLINAAVAEKDRADQLARIDRWGRTITR